MGKRGPKPKRKEPLRQTPELAYAVGLLVTDGCLSSSGRHIDLTSKDVEQLNNLKKCLEIKTKISYKTSSYTNKKYPRLQFSDVVLYKFLESIGMTPAKTKTIGKLDIPDKYFFDFLRGHHDGDGCFYSYWDPRWKSSFMYYLTFISASKKHVLWLQDKIKVLLVVAGRVNKNGSLYQLRFAKKESLKILKKMYPNKNVVCLSRKRLKIEKALGIVGESL